MAVYAIGDVQGCFDELCKLLEVIRFDSIRDRLWFVGDLVNRGPKSLEVLRFVKDMGDGAVTVLGNHDLHLLAVAYEESPYKFQDSFMDVLYAPDRQQLLDWLRHRPLIYQDQVLGFTLLHAGLPPQWDIVTACRCAAEVEQALKGDGVRQLLHHMYGNEPVDWELAPKGWDRLRYIINCYTRLRYCDAKGRLSLRYKMAPGTQPKGYLPWFQVPGRRSADERIVFGHWSTVGPYEGNNVYGLDSGCVWGGSLTALRLEDRRWFSVVCPEAISPDEA